MKLALVASTFLPARNSSAIQLRDLAHELFRQGHDITVFLPCSEVDGLWRVEELHGLRIVRLRAPVMADVGYLRRTLAEQIMPYAMIFSFSRSPLFRECWDGVIWYSPSIFHAPFVRLLKRRGACGGYLIVRDIFPEWAVDLGLLRRGFVYNYFKKIAEYQYDLADVIGVQSEGNLEYFKGWKEKFQDRQLEVLNNWLAPLSSNKGSFELEATTLAGREVFVYAGNMGVAQGIDILLDLAEKMVYRKDIGFLFIGRGSEMSRLRERAISSKLDNVMFHNEVAHEELSSIYRQCRVGLVSLDCQHKSHNIPGKFIGYLQNGLPVLASINKGNDLIQIIERNCVGYASVDGDIDDLVRKGINIVDNFKYDEELKFRCQRVFEELFSVEAACSQIVNALSKLR